MDDETFNSQIKDKIWLWHETRLADIAEAIRRNNLVAYRPDLFDLAVWASYQKT